MSYRSKIAEAVSNLHPVFPHHTRMLRNWADAMDWCSDSPEALRLMASLDRGTNEEVDALLHRLLDLVLIEEGQEARRTLLLLQLGCVAIFGAMRTEVNGGVFPSGQRPTGA